MSVDLHEPIFEVCRRFGLDPNAVARIELTPRTADVTIYKLNDDGEKYWDLEADKAATFTESYRITS